MVPGRFVSGPRPGPLTTQARQVRPFFIVRMVCADPVDHRRNKSAIVHIQLEP